MARMGLGRGLDALLGGDTLNQQNGVMQIKVYEIDTNSKQPRKSFDEEKLKELAASIERHGIIQPLLVKQNGSRYTIIAGERRYRAARLLGMTTVPAILSDLDEQKTAEVSLIENIQREDLNPIEEANAIRFLMVQHDLTQEEVSERIGKSRPVIANSLRLLKLEKEVQSMLADGVLSAGHAKMLAGVDEKDRQVSLARLCVKEGWSVRMLEDELRQSNKKAPTKRIRSAQSSEIQSITREFREHLRTKVVISGNEEKGKIVISYFSKDDLENIYQGILG
ncbi:MAG: ParB/RepB/Spo0J family partition protein [Eubacteriales bacterium]|nr:ParB/RepB/Spo0J family partition protein [Eubacteriales bacterium]